MTTTESFHVSDREQPNAPPYPPKPRRSSFLRWVLIFLPIFIFLLVIILVLSFTVFKVKNPTTQILSATVEGVSPALLLPQLKVELNITLDLEILVHNPNHASFRHDSGVTIVYYHETQVAEGDLSPGNVPATGSEILGNRITLQADQFLPNISGLVSDVMAGKFEIKTKSTVPGRVKFLFIHKHVVSLTNCRLVIGVPDLKVQTQECSNKIKF